MNKQINKMIKHTLKLHYGLMRYILVLNPQKILWSRGIGV